MRFVPGAPVNGGWMVAPAGQVSPGQPLPQLLPGQSLPGAMVMPGEHRQEAAIQELRTQLEQLRRDVEELKSHAKKGHSKRPAGE